MNHEFPLLHTRIGDPNVSFFPIGEDEISGNSFIDVNVKVDDDVTIPL